MANDPAILRVEVIFAWPDAVWRRIVDLPHGATLAHALDASGLFEQFPQLADPPAPAGVFGRVCPRDHVLRDGDRVEVYRPLVFDPMESRRRRALHRQRTAGATRRG
ncbi:RnfH family protein [Yanghanlia caeni]|uniref:UPF0125 protein Q8947_07170 n=1 Tax=Yanghanlia caeni TaxID=3064283 RepID=A0ABU1D5P4_9BURK|nr:RnfH family protein [Alcaligenaceae bacterium LG-2]NGR06538.1 RnfH family protein [bacterium SGD-2]HZH56249.1 RnfH family protein [Burkholderiaceae bacterium]